MKLLTTTALGLALAFGAVSLGGLAEPAMAAKPPKAPALQLSDPVRKSLAAAQEAMKTQNYDAALTSINEAKAAVSTPDDRFYTYNLLYEVAKAKQDSKLQAEGVDQMLQSGKVPAESVANFNLALGQLSYNNQDFAKAEQALAKAIELAPDNRDASAMLAETKFKLKKPAEAVGIIQAAADKAQTSGTPLPQDWLARGIAIGTDAKLGDPVAKLSYTWLKSYPEKTHWRDSLIIYRDLHPLDADYNLDLMRLQRAAGALKGERDYAEYAEATYLRFPGEAKSLLDEGVAAGALNLTKSRSLGELSSMAAGKIAADKASLKKTATNGRSAVYTGDAYASYGDYATAIALYKQAITLGGIDANMVNTRLGAALLKSGQKDEAKQVFSTITGPRAALATYWTILIDHPPTS